MLLEKANILPFLQEFERDEASFNQDVTILQAWLKTQAHLPEIIDINRIKSFLLLNKCRIEKTKKKIDMFYTIRTLLPEFYDNHPKQPLYQESMKMLYFVALPKLTKNQDRIVVFTTRDPSLIEHTDPVYAISTCLHIFEMRLFEDNTYNDIYVFDMKHLTTTYCTKMLPVLPKLIQNWESVYSMRLKAMYIINAHPLLGMMLNLVKTLVKAKIFKRIHILEDQSMLFDVLPKEILPKDFNGDGQPLEELWNVCNEDFKKYEKYFDDRQIKRVNEKLRVELINSPLEVYGNFKKLNVD